MAILNRSVALRSTQLSAVARRSYAHPPTSRSVPHVPPSSNGTQTRMDILRATPLSIKAIMFGLTLLGFSTGILVGSKAPRPPTADEGVAFASYPAGSAGSSAPNSPYAALRKRAAEQAAGVVPVESEGLTKGIEELRSFFRTLGREDDVTVQATGPGYKNPTVVVRALRTEEIQKIVSIAIRFSIPLINHADITSSTSGGIMLDLTRLRAQ